NAVPHGCHEAGRTADLTVLRLIREQARQQRFHRGGAMQQCHLKQGSVLICHHDLAMNEKSAPGQ
ncbi:hypothetical protein NZA98_05315, partial [Escherichia coli]|nr:hypothetical protein [Escherichia coli]